MRQEAVVSRHSVERNWLAQHQSEQTRAGNYQQAGNAQSLAPWACNVENLALSCDCSCAHKACCRAVAVGQALQLAASLFY